jgi:adhesin/invasin
MYIGSDITASIRRAWCGGLCAAAAVVVSGCDSAPLLAPTQSTITVSAPARVLPNGGTTEVSAYVVEQAGTAVQNGTAVRFTTTLGTLDPPTALTHNGVARTMFSAGSVSGIAEIRATSGSATGGDNNLNLVRITVGAAAVSTISIRANPAAISPSGGTVELIATVVGENAEAVQGVTVTFSADQGTLSSQTGVTDTQGEARTTLTTTQQTVVSATAGTKTSGNVTVGLRAGPVVSLTCAPAAGTGNCAALQMTGAANIATALLTVTKATASSALRSATLEFGDGETLSLGNLAGGSATIAHGYEGPSSGGTPRTYTATLRVEDVNGESSVTTTTVTVLPRAALGVSLTATAGTATASGQLWSFTATVTDGGTTAVAQSYAWEFGDGSSTTTSGGSTSKVYTANGQQTVRLTVTMPDGRTASTSTEILVRFP